MFEEFETYLRSFAPFTQDELNLMRSVSTIKKIRKRQLILKEGEVCNTKTYVQKGLLRTYALREDGTEIIMRFAPHDSWIMDHASYYHHQPAKFNIDALEDSDIIQWTRENFDRLLQEIPSLHILSEKVKTRTLDDSQDRILLNISGTPEEKYQEFVRSYPDVFNRVPLHMIASYLGLSRETLTRVRQSLLKRSPTS